MAKGDAIREALDQYESEIELCTCPYVKSCDTCSTRIAKKATVNTAREELDELLG